MIDRAGHKAYAKAAKEDEERGGAMVGGKFRKFRFAETTRVTEVGVSGYSDGTSERVVFGTPIVIKKDEDMMMAMAKRIVELEGEVIDLQGSICNTPSTF